MRTATCALLLLAPTALAAQTREEPNLIFSFSLGLTTGRDLWNVPEQPMPVTGSANFDTANVSRLLRPGVTATLSATLFASPRFGYTAEIGYYGIASEQRCIGPATYQPEPTNTNEQSCTRANGAHRATSVVGFQVGGMWRMSPTTRVTPFLRGTAGLGLIGNSYVETTGAVISGSGFATSPIITPDSKASATWIATITGGLSMRIAPAYQLRMELRDVITSLPVADGPAVTAGVGPIAPTARRVVHIPTFMIGLDLIFERRHTRRY